MRRLVTAGSIMGTMAAAALEGAAGMMGGYRPDTYAPTSQSSKDEDKRRAEEKRMRRQAKRQQQIKG